MAIDADGLDARTGRYDRVVTPLESRLRRALVARFGVDVGCDAAADALAWAWEHLDRVESVANPAGYLFRVGQSSAKRAYRWRRRSVSFPEERRDDHSVDAGVGVGDVFDALKDLPPNQRVSVLLVHGYGFTYREVADLLDVTEAAVTNYVHRGLTKARTLLGEDQ